MGIWIVVVSSLMACIGIGLVYCRRAKFGMRLFAVGLLGITVGAATDFERARSWQPETLTVESAEQTLGDGKVTALVRFRGLPERQFVLEFRGEVPDLKPGAKVQAESRVEGDRTLYRFP